MAAVDHPRSRSHPLNTLYFPPYQLPLNPRHQHTLSTPPATHFTLTGHTKRDVSYGCNANKIFAHMGLGSASHMSSVAEPSAYWLKRGNVNELKWLVRLPIHPLKTTRFQNTIFTHPTNAPSQDILSLHHIYTRLPTG